VAKSRTILAPKTRVRSMTGYGRARLEGALSTTAEVRSVNGRFLKLNVKVPGRYGALEDRIKELLSELGVKRGNIDVNIFLEGGFGEDGRYNIDETVVKHFLSQGRAVLKKCGLKEDLSLNALLPLPGVIKRDDTGDNIDAVWVQTKKALTQAVEHLNSMREREGAAMAADLRTQFAALREHHAAIQACASETLKNIIQRFKERIAKLMEQSGAGVSLNPDALEREIVLMGDRMDVSEELARLSSHFQQMEAALDEGGETGKKLDFLTQELLRETNTIGSKAQDEQITYRVVGMKGIIERIREQVQNLE
jgi:uncharacterized protein (TIGR00255 family)